MDLLTSMCAQQADEPVIRFISPQYHLYNKRDLSNSQLRVKCVNLQIISAHRCWQTIIYIYSVLYLGQCLETVALPGKFPTFETASNRNLQDKGQSKKTDNKEVRKRNPRW